MTGPALLDGTVQLADRWRVSYWLRRVTLDLGVDDGAAFILGHECGVAELGG
jgi:hypothetical protein